MLEPTRALPTAEHTKLLARAEDAVLAVVSGKATVFPTKDEFTKTFRSSPGAVVYIADHTLASEYLDVMRAKPLAPGVSTLEALTAMLQTQTGLELA